LISSISVPGNGTGVYVDLMDLSSSTEYSVDVVCTDGSESGNAGEQTFTTEP
jgi:hypothetical protein